MNLGQAIAQRANELLSKSGKTQYRVAKEMTISQNTMTNMVNGKTKKTNLPTLFLFCRALNISVDEFFSDPIFADPTLEID